MDRREYLKYTGAAAYLPFTGDAGRAAGTTVEQGEGSGQADPPPAPTDLRTEYETAPDDLPPSTDPATTDGGDPSTPTSQGDQEPFAPRFSWRGPVDERGADQRAYRLVVASNRDLFDLGIADVYDSGKVESARSTAVSFDADEVLEPEATYYWRVRVWDETDEPSPWSEPARFTMAIPDAQDHWDGTWIGNHPPSPAAPPSQVSHARNERSPLLRTEFDLEKEIERARAYVVSLGYGEVYVNGERVGDAVLDPAWTWYHQRVLFSTYDVTDPLRQGDNALGLWLGRGWFSKSWGIPLAGIIAGRMAEGQTGAELAHHFGGSGYSPETKYGPPRALLQLNVEYSDGTTDAVATDTSWQAHPSPIVENEVYEGETYDAVLEQPGWAEPGFDAAGWTPATELPLYAGKNPDHESAAMPADPAVRPQRTQPIEVTETLEPVSVRTYEGDHVVDFGQNFAGWVELTVRDASAGDEIVLQHAERLRGDGDVDRRSNRTADATDTYIAKGVSEEVYEPRFTYHGFRYVKVEGYPGDLSPDDVAGKVVRTATEQTGSFACSNDDLDQVQHNAVWGLRSNRHGVPTDCPQRDERLGWTGDATVVAPADLFNFDAERFYEKWLRDHADVQNTNGTVENVIPNEPTGTPADPNWGKTRVTIPWVLYQHTGDERVLADHYEGMKAYVEYWHEQAEEHVVPAAENQFGDHMAMEGWFDQPVLLNTFAHYQTTEMVARAADALGKTEDAARYEQRRTAIAEAFNDEFFDPATNTYGDGYQTSYALPLFADIVPDAHEEQVVDNLATKIREEDDGTLQTGFVGTRPLIFALVRHGHEGLAYHVVSQSERPGWVYMVRNGATTMWEGWDILERNESGDTLNSFNHSPLPLVSEWFYRVLAGIDAAEPGFEHVEIDPHVLGDLEWAEATTETVRGEVASRWERTNDGLELDVRLPWNTTGTVRVPDLNADEVRLVEGGDVLWDDSQSGGAPPAPGRFPAGIDSVSRTNDAVVVAVGSGDYEFELVVPDESDEQDDPDDGEGDDDAPRDREPGTPAGLDWTDYAFESTFTIENRAAGFVFRAQDAENFYLWQIVTDTPAATTGNAELRTHVFTDGTAVQRESVPVALGDVDAQHTCRIDLEGQRITTYVDGDLVHTTVDPTYEAGTIGYRAVDVPSEHVLVDDVAVVDTDGETLFATDFSHDSVAYFSGGRIVDDRLSVRGDGVVLRTDR